VSDVTQLLNAIEAGEPEAADQLLPLVYEELRKLAVVRMANEKAGQTLQPTALVQEAWLKIAGDHEYTHPWTRIVINGALSVVFTSEAKAVSLHEIRVHWRAFVVEII
jgi:hypothetical protein